MTHFDHRNDAFEFSKYIEEVKALKSQFQGVLNFDDDEVVIMVDGQGQYDARHVFNFMKFYLKESLGRLQKTIKACEEIQQCIAK